MTEHLTDVDQLIARLHRFTQGTVFPEPSETLLLVMDAWRLLVHTRDQRHRNDRWNVETTTDGFRICRGDHERSAGCKWEYFVPRTTETTGVIDGVTKVTLEGAKVWRDGMTDAIYDTGDGAK